MYTDKHFLPDELLGKAADSVLENDRLSYAPYFKAVEYYMIEHGMILGGKCSIDLLLGNKLNKDSFYYEIYSRKVEEHSRKLVDILGKIDKNSIVYRDTQITDKEYIIEINMRRLFLFHSLDNKQDYDIKTMIAPRPIKGYFGGKEILCMNPKVHLMSIYRNLYRPYPSTGQGYTTYSVLLKNLQELHNKAAIGFHDIVSPDIVLTPVVSVDGGFDIHWKNSIIEETILSLSADKKTVFIGDFVIDRNPAGRLQVLSADSIDIFVNKLRNNLSESRPDIQVTYKYQNLYLPNDFQLVKYTVYVNELGKDKFSMMDVFNSPTYELISVRKGGNVFTPGQKIITTIIGNDFVLLRFKLIDLWIMQLIHMHKENIKDFSRKKIEDILEQIDTLYKQTLRKIEQNPLELFPTDANNYIGVYTDEYVAKKKFLTKGRFEQRLYYTAK